MARKLLVLFLAVFAVILFAIYNDSFGVDPNRSLTTGEIVDVADKGESRIYRVEYGEGLFFEEEHSQLDPIEFGVGDKVIISANKFEDQVNFLIEEPARGTVLWVVLAVFAILVYLVAGSIGLYSLLGLLFTVFVLIFGLLPMLLQGYNPLLVTSGIGAVVITATVLLSHGITRKSVAALLGILGTLIVTTIFAIVVVRFGDISALQNEELRFLLFDLPNLDIVGVTIAAIILGLLGVLDDVAVSQSSVVFELLKANPKMTFKELYLSAMEVGRDHIASTVNTLAMAYIGASLPIFLLVFQGSLAELPFVLQFEVMSVELLRILIGSIGIVFCIPLTNLLACVFVKQNWLDELEDGESHVCGHC